MTLNVAAARGCGDFQTTEKSKLAPFKPSADAVSTTPPGRVPALTRTMHRPLKALRVSARFGS